MAKRRKKGPPGIALFAGALVVALIAVLGYLELGDKPLDSRAAIDAAVRQARLTRELSSEHELVLRVQLAITDYIATNGSPPNSLGDLVAKYFDSPPINPVTNEPLAYVKKGNTYLLGEQVTGPREPKAVAGSETSRSGTVVASLAGESIKLDFVNPNLMETEEFVYDPNGKRDPFLPFDLSPKVPRTGNLTPLERYSLGQLRVTAIILDMAKERVAFVENAAGRGFAIREGTKIGDQNGVVVSIEENHIKVLERTIDFAGKEKKNVVEMAISTGDSSEKKKK